MTAISSIAFTQSNEGTRFHLAFLEHIDKHPKEGEAINFDSSGGRIKTDFILFNDLHKLIDGYYKIEIIPAIKRKEEAERQKKAEEDAQLKADEDAREMLKSLGPELFEDTAGFHPLVNNFSSVWEFGQDLSVQYVSDAKP